MGALFSWSGRSFTKSGRRWGGSFNQRGREKLHSPKKKASFSGDRDGLAFEGLLEGGERGSGLLEGQPQRDHQHQVGRQHARVVKESKMGKNQNVYCIVYTMQIYYLKQSTVN